MMAPSKKVIYAALTGNCLIAISKVIAAVMTGSSAMLSEAVHSVADTGNEILLLYGLRRAKMPADNQFPFGHGKEIYFWTLTLIKREPPLLMKTEPLISLVKFN